MENKLQVIEQRLYQLSHYHKTRLDSNELPPFLIRVSLGQQKDYSSHF